MNKGNVIKRIVDLIIISIFSPFMLITLFILALNLLLSYGKPIIFKQKRIGYLAKPFYIYKFRTMNFDINRNGKLFSDARRLTTFGKFLRRSSLDELPELWNVIKGDMSLVGPRALLVEYIDRYTAEQARRHEVKPGITGWAQINGRNSISWEEKFKLDVWYVDNCNLFLDLKILLLTLFKVIKMEGISAKNHATMPKFGEEDAG